MVRAVVQILLLIYLGCHWRASAEAEEALPFDDGCKCVTSLGSPAAGLLILAQADTDPEPVSDSDTGTPTIKRKLDRRTRIELMSILVMLVAVGLGLLAFTWLTARLTRRYMKPSEKRAARPLDSVFTDDWAAKPLTEQERAKLESPDW